MPTRLSLLGRCATRGQRVPTLPIPSVLRWQQYPPKVQPENMDSHFQVALGRGAPILVEWAFMPTRLRLWAGAQRVGSKCPPYPFRLCGIGSNIRQKGSLKNVDTHFQAALGRGTPILVGWAFMPTRFAFGQVATRGQRVPILPIPFLRHWQQHRPKGQPENVDTHFQAALGRGTPILVRWAFIPTRLLPSEINRAG